MSLFEYFMPILSSSDMGTVLFCSLLPFLLFSGQLILYLLARRQLGITFHIATKKVTALILVARGWINIDSVVVCKVYPVSTGFHGEVRFRNMTLAHTEVKATEEEVRQELVPFCNALNHTMGFVASFSTDQPQTAANLHGQMAKR